MGADLKLINVHRFFTKKISFAPKPHQQLLFWLWQIIVTTTVERTDWM